MVCVFVFRLQNYVREQILQAVAVIFKRGTMEMKDSGRDGLFADVSQMIASGQPSMVRKTFLQILANISGLEFYI